MDDFFARLRRGGVLAPLVFLGAASIVGFLHFQLFQSSNYFECATKTSDMPWSAGNATACRALQKQVEKVEAELHERSLQAERKIGEAVAVGNQNLTKKVEQLEAELESRNKQQQQQLEVNVAETPTAEHQRPKEIVEMLEAELKVKNAQEQKRIEVEREKEQQPQTANIVDPPAAECEELKETVKKLEAELAIKKIQGQESTTSVVNPNVIQNSDAAENLRPKSCRAILKRMHKWNHCWRRHMMVNQDKGLRQLLETDITCPVLTESGTLATEVIGAPLYQHAHYHGQGFGRVVGHTAQACMVAFLLKRPCLINMSSRDKHYTWRFFINENTCPWNPSILHNHPTYLTQLEDVAKKLPNQGIGQWKDNTNSADHENGNDKPVSLVFPMDKALGKENYTQILEYYSGNHPLHGNQVMFSPNWADAWFTKIPFQRFQAEHSCLRTELATLVQNALYTPTDLSLKTHQVRYNQAASTLWNKGNKERTDNSISTKTTKDSNEFVEHRTRPHLSAPSNAANAMPTYGSIHIRTIIILLANKGESTETKKFVDQLLVCLKKVSTLPNFTMPKNWWILADNSTVAEEITDSIHAQQEETPKNFNDQLPHLKIFNNYNLTAVDGNALSSAHSNSKLAKGLYGHRHMAGSIEDWIALHESKVTIVTKGSGYSVTGASGNGKTDAGHCGPCSMFTIMV